MSKYKLQLNKSSLRQENQDCSMFSLYIELKLYSVCFHIPKYKSIKFLRKIKKAVNVIMKIFKIEFFDTLYLRRHLFNTKLVGLLI